MRVVRTAAQRGFILPERGYPLPRRRRRSTARPSRPSTFAIARQESGFDPRVRSGVGARGMMQLMPATAALVARKMGERLQRRSALRARLQHAAWARPILGQHGQTTSAART